LLKNRRSTCDSYIHVAHSMESQGENSARAGDYGGSKKITSFFAC
jgi:hypothetical protein